MTRNLVSAKYILPRYSAACRRKMHIQIDDCHTAHVACQSRRCPICRRVWEARKDVEVQFIMENTPGRLYRAECRRFHWKAMYHQLHKRGGNYYAAEIQPGAFWIITDVQVPGAEPINRFDARALMKNWAREARPVLKPILISTRWKIPRERRVVQPAKERQLGIEISLPRGLEVQDILAGARQVGIGCEVLSDGREDRSRLLEWDFDAVLAAGVPGDEAVRRLRAAVVSYSLERNKIGVTETLDPIRRTHEAYLRRIIGET